MDVNKTQNIQSIKNKYSITECNQMRTFQNYAENTSLQVFESFTTRIRIENNLRPH